MRTIVRKDKWIWVPLILLGIFSCTPELSDTGFFDEEDLLFSIATYIKENQEDFSTMWKIIEVTGSFDALNAYNPEDSEGRFTFFLPTNAAVETFVSKSRDYSSIDEMLADPEYCIQLIRPSPTASRSRRSIFDRLRRLPLFTSTNTTSSILP